MIWGETQTDRRQRMRRDAEYRMEVEAMPRRVFAWWPTRLTDGRIAWFEAVMTCIRHIPKYVDSFNKPYVDDPYRDYYHNRVYWAIKPIPKERRRA